MVSTQGKLEPSFICLAKPKCCCLLILAFFCGAATFLSPLYKWVGVPGDSRPLQILGRITTQVYSSSTTPPVLERGPWMSMHKDTGGDWSHQVSADQCKGPVGVPGAEPVEALDLTRSGPFPFLKEYRNPCWPSPPPRPDLQCLPYFYLAGFPKCGTTDMYFRIVEHPDVKATRSKEVHWITRRRFQLGKDVSSLNWYTHFYGYSLRGAGGKQKIVGDGSASTAWDNTNWHLLPGNENCSEPQVLNADYVRHLNHHVKIIMILRNPTSRLYSDYMYFNRQRSKSQESFHILAQKQISEFVNCLKDKPLRNCAYSNKTQNLVRLNVGLYAIYIADWFLRFPRDQILVVRMEDVSHNTIGEMSKVFRFLNLSQLSGESMRRIAKLKPRNVNVRAKAHGPMMEKTRIMLDNFYRPYNKWLSHILADEKYTWKDV